MVQVLIDNVTYYLLQYVTCYYGSLSAPWQKFKCSLLVGIRMLSRWPPWWNVLRMFRQFCGALVPKSPLLIICQPNVASVNSTASWDDTGRPWGAHSMTLYWWRKASLLLCTFLLISNTICILIFVGHIFWECPVSEDFRDYILQHILCLKICDPCGLPL